MITIKNTICILLIIFAFYSCEKKKNVEVCSGFQDKIYVYSIYHCTEADSLDCSQKVITSLLLPDQYLKCSSTDSLSQTCLNYPFFGYIWAYNSFQQGFDRVKDMFNGIDELISREDANSSLMKIYQRMHPEDVNDISNSVDRGAFMSQFNYIEITLAQFQLVNNLTLEQIKTLLNLCLEIYHKKSNISYYSWIGEMSTLAIMARILYSRNYEPVITELSQNSYLESFLNTADFMGFNDINKISEITQFVVNATESYLSE